MNGHPNNVTSDDEKTLSDAKQPLKAKKATIYSLPSVLISNICHLLSPIDIVNLMVSNQMFESFAGYVLSRRELRLDTLDLTGSSTMVRLLLGYEFDLFIGWDGMDEIRINPSNMDNKSAMTYLAGVVYYVMSSSDCSEVLMHVLRKVSHETHFIDALSARFGTDEFGSYHRLAIDVISGSDTVPFLKLFHAEILEIGSEMLLDGEGQLLQPLLEGVESLYLVDEGMDPSVDVIMEQCKLSDIELHPDVEWSKESFHRVLTNHALSQDASRTIRFYRPANQQKYVEWFEEWSASVGSAIAERDGVPVVSVSKEGDDVVCELRGYEEMVNDAD